MDFITTVLGPEVDRNIDFLTIHPRTRTTPSSTPIDIDALQLLTSTFGTKVPILVSGDVLALHALPYTSPLHAPTVSSTTAPPKHQPGAPHPDDGQAPPDPPRRLPIPHLAGLMSARALLANPALFAGFDACPWEAVEVFLAKAARAPLPFKLVQHHLGEMCGPGMGPNKAALLAKAERVAMLACGNMCDLLDFLDAKRGGDGLRRW